jgi:phosphoribosylformylglycinamidine synthase
MATDAIIAIQDMGAAGLTSSSVEMADKGGVGLDLDIDAVPQREDGMSPYEVMLSESQERMLMVLRPGAEDTARAIFEKWQLDFAVVGKVSDTGRFIGRAGGEVVFDIPVRPLVDEAPEYERPWVKTEPPAPLGAISAPMDHLQALQALLAGPDLSSRRWVWEQYDHTVMADTVAKPGGDAAIVRLHGSNRGLAVATDCTPRYCRADPEVGGAQAVAETWRNLTAVGARPLAITDCLNFGNPERPEIMGQFVGCVQGMGEACRALDFPVVSGNVSLYNETNGQAILPTPAIGGIGMIDDLERFAGLALQRADDILLLVGGTKGHLGQSIYLRQLLGRADGPPPAVDLEAERRNGDFVRRLISDGWIDTCHDISDGGLLVAAAEMAMAGNLGISLAGPDDTGFWFGEDQGRYILALPDSSLAVVLQRAGQDAVPLQTIGRTGRETLTLNASPPISISELRRSHEAWLPEYMSNA